MFLQSTSQILTRGARQRAKIQTRGRAMVNNEISKKQSNVVKSADCKKKSTITLTEAKRVARENNQRNAHSAKTTHNEVLVKDIYQNVKKSLH